MGTLRNAGRTVVRIGPAALIVLLLASCSWSGKQKTVTIENVKWTVENIDRGYWRSDPPGTPPRETAFLSFWIDFEENDLKASDITEVKISDPAGYSWTFGDPSAVKRYMDSAGDVFGGWMRLSTDQYDPESASVLRIGTYTITVTLSNGGSGICSRTIPAPGSSSTGENMFVYTEDVSSAGGVPSGFAPLPRRAVISSASIDEENTTLTVRFSIEDDRVYSGTILLYDDGGDQIGTSGSGFRSDGPDTISPAMNGGEVFHTDGTENTVILPPAGLLFPDGGDSLGNTAWVVVMLTDGWQYMDGRNDTLSATGRFSVSRP